MFKIKIFKSTTMKINEKWSIKSDSENNCCLVFEEMRETTNKEGVKTQKLFTDIKYYPTIFTALKGYLEYTLEQSEDVKDCIKRMEDTFEQLKKVVDGKR